LSVVSVVLSGRGLCDGLITGPEESYRLWCVIVCDLETSRMRRLKRASGFKASKRRRRHIKYLLKYAQLIIDSGN
jgi:2-phosphoglycerate kinase